MATFRRFIGVPRYAALWASCAFLVAACGSVASHPDAGGPGTGGVAAGGGLTAGANGAAGANGGAAGVSGGAPGTGGKAAMAGAGGGTSSGGSAQAGAGGTGNSASGGAGGRPLAGALLQRSGFVTLPIPAAANPGGVRLLHHALSSLPAKQCAGNVCLRGGFSP